MAGPSDRTILLRFLRSMFKWIFGAVLGYGTTLLLAAQTWLPKLPEPSAAIWGHVVDLVGAPLLPFVILLVGAFFVYREEVRSRAEPPPPTRFRFETPVGVAEIEGDVEPSVVTHISDTWATVASTNAKIQLQPSIVAEESLPTEAGQITYPPASELPVGQPHPHLSAPPTSEEHP